MPELGYLLKFFVFERDYFWKSYFWKKRILILNLTLTFRTANNFEKPPLHSKIPGYTPDKQSKTTTTRKELVSIFTLLCQIRSRCWKNRKLRSCFENCYHHAKMVEKKEINVLVSPYFTLLFSRKENLKFSELALVTVDCSCLVGCIMIVRTYLPWNTANTIAGIYVLVEKGNQNTETKCKVCSNY